MTAARLKMQIGMNELVLKQCNVYEKFMRLHLIQMVAALKGMLYNYNEECLLIHAEKPLMENGKMFELRYLTTGTIEVWHHNKTAPVVYLIEKAPYNVIKEALAFATQNTKMQIEELELKKAESQNQ